MKLYKLKADILFSRYVRRLNSKDGKNVCFTCGRIFAISELQCGHYISRSHNSVRWFIHNAKPQCRNCNEVLKGNLSIYRIYLVRIHGETFVETIESLARNLQNIYLDFKTVLPKSSINEVVKHYQNKLLELL